MRHSPAQRPDPRERQHPNGWLRSWGQAGPGRRDDDQGDAQLRPVASSTRRWEERDQERHAEVPLLVSALVSFVGRRFSTNSRPSSAGSTRRPSPNRLALRTRPAMADTLNAGTSMQQ